MKINPKFINVKYYDFNRFKIKHLKSSDFVNGNYVLKWLLLSVLVILNNILLFDDHESLKPSATIYGFNLCYTS